MSLTDCVGDIVAAFLDLLQDMRADAVFLQELCGSRGGLNVEAEVVETANQRERLFLVLLGDGHEYGSVIL